MIYGRFARWLEQSKNTLRLWGADFHRKFWTWVYIEAGKRLQSLDVAAYWDRHWRYLVAHRLHQTEERYGMEIVKYLLTPTDGANSQARDYRDTVRDVRVRR